MAVSQTDWARTVNTTIVKYLRQEEKHILRQFPVYQDLVDGGRVKFNQGGRGINWQVRYRNQPVVGNTGTQPIDFAQHNLDQTAELPYRGYVVSDAIYEKEQLENSGEEALVDIAGRMSETLQTSISQALGPAVYGDGGAANAAPSTSTDWHGIESFMGITSGSPGSSASTIDLSVASTGFATRTSGNTADMFASPGDSYAGLSTTLGTLSGSYLTTVVASGTSPDQAIATHWPNGMADTDLDFWSPILVNYTSTSFNGAAATWQEQCLEAMRAGIIQSQRNNFAQGKLINKIGLDRNLLYQFKNKQEAKEQIVIDSSGTGTKSFGLAGRLLFDNCEVFSDYGIPAGVGYGFNTSFMELRAMHDVLLKVGGPYEDENTQAMKWKCRTLSNLMFKKVPCFFKLAAYA